jgi:hypothetical protein
MDLCNKYGAEVLAARITAYWRERGYEVNCTIHEQMYVVAMRSARYDVRSDMVNGLPRDYRK